MWLEKVLNVGADHDGDAVDDCRPSRVLAVVRQLRIGIYSNARADITLAGWRSSGDSIFPGFPADRWDTRHTAGCRGRHNQ